MLTRRRAEQKIYGSLSLAKLAAVIIPVGVAFFPFLKEVPPHTRPPMPEAPRCCSRLCSRAAAPPRGMRVGD